MSEQSTGPTKLEAIKFNFGGMNETEGVESSLSAQVYDGQYDDGSDAMPGANHTSDQLRAAFPPFEEQHPQTLLNPDTTQPPIAAEPSAIPDFSTLVARASAGQGVFSPRAENASHVRSSELTQRVDNTRDHEQARQAINEIGEKVQGYVKLFERVNADKAELERVRQEYLSRTAELTTKYQDDAVREVRKSLDVQADIAADDTQLTIAEEAQDQSLATKNNARRVVQNTIARLDVLEHADTTNRYTGQLRAARQRLAAAETAQAAVSANAEAEINAVNQEIISLRIRVNELLTWSDAEGRLLPGAQGTRDLKEGEEDRRYVLPDEREAYISKNGVVQYPVKYAEYEPGEYPEYTLLENHRVASVIEGAIIPSKEASKTRIKAEARRQYYNIQAEIDKEIVPLINHLKAEAENDDFRIAQVHRDRTRVKRELDVSHGELTVAEIDHQRTVAITNTKREILADTHRRKETILPAPEETPEVVVVKQMIAEFDRSLTAGPTTEVKEPVHGIGVEALILFHKALSGTRELATGALPTPLPRPPLRIEGHEETDRLTTGHDTTAIEAD